MKNLKHLKRIVSKNNLLFVYFFLFTISIQAQTEIDIAKNFLKNNSIKQELATSDLEEMMVSSSYLSPSTGWFHIYFNQKYQSVEVYNGVLNVALQNGQVDYVANSFVKDLALKTQNIAIKGLISPVQALRFAFSSLNLDSKNATLITQISSSSLASGEIYKGTYLAPEISNDKIEIKLYWLQNETLIDHKIITKVNLSWNVKFFTKDGQNSWNIQIDAISGNIIQTLDDVIHCDFGKPENLISPIMGNVKEENNQIVKNPLIANSYSVFDYPIESPNHGSITSVINPYNKFVPSGTGPGLTNGWHNDGTIDYVTTRGNNVFAKEDLAADNEVTIGASPISPTLDFNFPYSQTTETAILNRNSSITNLFYWNNVMHDILWEYGFDEPSGNFQKDNMGRGGQGNDFVFADAQDGSGTNNANFSTPADGSNSRMQMYIFSDAGNPAYQPDSDFDNGVIAHEYGHGWSIRLTGGPANVNCLQNAEQAGEGWSDYAALMTTTNWSTLTPTIASANISRGIGTYVIGQSPSGRGIRPFYYSYDKTNVNNLVTYGGVSNSSLFSQPHGIGSIWATMLWDMTWEIIFQDNQIVNNIYNVPASINEYRGNIAALKLVNEGLRLQPCSPSFVQARDAILQADQMLFSGRYRCAISKAFTRRGLGLYASTGTTSNDRTVTEDFTPIAGPTLSSPLTASICSNSVFNYLATTSTIGVFAFAWTRASVVGISNPAASGSSAIISESLINTTNNPITVTYFFTITPNSCGGLPVPIAVNVVVNPSVTPSVASYSVCQNTVVPSGQGLVVPTVVFTNSINGTIVAGLTFNRGSGNNATTYSASGSSVYFKTYSFVAPSNGPVTFFTTFARLSPSNSDDTYLFLYQNSFNPASPATNFLRGDDDSGFGFLSSFTHTLVAGTTYEIVVSTFYSQEVGSFTLQSSIPLFGQTINWYSNATGGLPLAIGSVFNPVGVPGSGIVNTSSLGSTIFHVSDALYPSCRVPVTFNVVTTVAGSVSSSTTVCNGTNNGILTLSGHSGSILRWESSTDNFLTIINIANTTTNLLYSNLSLTTKYRAVVKDGNCPESPSASATITVTNGTNAGSVTSDATVCNGSNSGILTLTGHSGTILRWETSVDNFVSIVTIANNSTTQSYTNLTQTTRFRAIVQNGNCSISTSVPATITVITNTVVGGIVSSNNSVCAGTNAGTLNLSGHVGTIIRWESSVNNFLTSVPISNSTTTFNYSNLSQTTKYRALIQNTFCGGIPSPQNQAYSSEASITVNPLPIVNITGNQIICPGASTTLTANCGLLSVFSTLNGGSQVPTNSSTGTGNLLGTFNPTSNFLQFSILFNGLSSNASDLHIHKAAIGSNGPIQIAIPGIPSATFGTVNYSVTLTSDQTLDLLAGLYYVNLHTLTNPSGEIRGQLNTTCIANSYVWSPGAVNGSTISVNPTNSSVYSVTALNSSTGCSASASTAITVLPNPSASNNGPYFVGQTIALSSSSGTSYSWSGPNGFSSSMANPSIGNAQILNAGVYTVSVSNTVCTATATTNVVVNLGIDPCVQILSYSYVQAGNPHSVLFPLSNEQNIAESQNQTSIIVKPICNTVPIESVSMNITGPYFLNWTILKSFQPFALYDNSGTIVNGQRLAPGNYNLTITGFAQKFGLGGITYGPIVTTFNIVANPLTPPTISEPIINGTEFCAGANMTVNFTTTGLFSNGNIFQVVLSDANGSFNNLTNIIGSTTTAGSVLCSFPSTASGNNYKIKIVSTNVAVSGGGNLGAFTVNPLVLNLVSPANDYTNSTIISQAGQTINASNSISGNSNVQFNARNSINLTPGFKVVSSSTSSFKVSIGGCN